MPPLENSSVIKIGKFKGSLMIAKQSMAVIMQDKEILLFPVLSFICTSIIILVALSVLFFVTLNGNINNIENIKNADGVSITFAFLFYLLITFTINFFQTGIFLISNKRFENGDMNFSQAISESLRNIDKILTWSLIVSTVGLILDMISNKPKADIGKIVSMILGAAWNILTFFSLPSLIIGQKSVSESFKDSASIIRKTWGETIIINLGAGLFFGLVAFVGTLIGIFIIFLSLSSPALILLSILLLVIFYTLIGVVSSTINSIFKVAIYKYATTGVLPNIFSPELIMNAISSRQN